MASFLNFLSGVVGALLGTDGESGATLVLSGSGNSVTFPVAPASFDVECGYNNSVINVNSLGDINIIMGPLSRPRSKILRVAVSRIILSSEASKVKLVGNLVA